MNVLVTGATGFVGSHVVDVLLDRGFDVSYIARASSNLRWMNGKRARRVDGSLFDYTTLRTAVGEADMIIHVAGVIAAKNEAEFMRGNRDATQHLIDAVDAYRPSITRFTHISSLAVAGPASSLEQPVRESDICKPITAYGRTKRSAEDVIHAAAGRIPTTILRPPAVYGPRDEATLTFFQTVNKGVAPLIGFDEKYISFINVKDLARGIVDATLHPKAVGETYFITSRDYYTWPEISTVTAAVLGKQRIRRIRLPHGVVLGLAGVAGFVSKFRSKPGVLDYEKGIDITRPYWICSPDKALRELGFQSQLSLHEGIQDTITWYREMGWL